jgi:hypothetical protein
MRSFYTITICPLEFTTMNPDEFTIGVAFTKAAAVAA